MASYKSSSSVSSESSVDLDDFEVLSIKEESEINILLLGETGVGKSTFINSIGNYLSLKYFNNARQRGLVKVIPSSYMIQDKNGKYCNVQIGSKKDKTETLMTGESATQQVKTYVFPISSGNVKVRLIDTPGMGDTRGVEQDEINCENIISYIKTLDKIHAICFLFKPTNARKTIYFNYCIYQVLSLLEKSAVENICFLFSHTKGSDYGPGDTLAVLTDVLKNIEDDTGVKIPLDTKRNIFCFDNEAFRYLGAREKNVQVDFSAFDKSKASWIHSARECWKFIRYLQKDITPYVPKMLLELYDARKLIAMLSKVLTEITQLIEDNKRLLERMENNKSEELDLIAKMRMETTKVTDIVQTKMCKPILVCTAVPSCAEVYRVRGVDKWHYKDICHSCYELDDNVVRLFTAGCPDIIQCNSINKNTRLCTRCGCDFLLHMHVNFITALKEEYRTDEDIDSRISAKETFLRTHKETEDQIKLNNAELQNEYDAIKLFCTLIAKFIRKNAIIDVSDSYKDYVVYLIEQSQSSTASSVTVTKKDLEKLVAEYAEIEKIFKLPSTISSPSLKNFSFSFNINDSTFQNLYQLKHFGQKIHDLYKNLKFTDLNTQSVKEYVHDSYFIEERDGLEKNRGQKNERRGGKNTGPPFRNNHFNPKNNRPDSRNNHLDPRPNSRNAHVDSRNKRPDSRNSHMEPRNNRSNWNNSRDIRKDHNNCSYTDPRNVQDFNNTHQQNPPYYQYNGPNYPSREFYNLQSSNPHFNAAAPSSQYRDPRMFPQYDPRFPPWNNTRQPQGNSNFRPNYPDNRRSENQRQDQNSNRGRYTKHHNSCNNERSRRRSSVPRKGKQEKRKSSQVRRNKNKETSSESDSSDSSS